VLPALADQDRHNAADLARTFVENVTRMGAPEWITGEGQIGGATGFIAALAVPMMALSCILKRQPFSDFF
jgi:hypothetical protein